MKALNRHHRWLDWLNRKAMRLLQSVLMSARIGRADMQVLRTRGIDNYHTNRLSHPAIKA